MNWLKYQQTALTVGLGLACLVSGTLTAKETQAATLFSANLTSSQQVPPNSSTATGFGTVLLNDAQNMIAVNFTYTGLTTQVTVGHIHGPAPLGVNAPVLFDFTSALPPASTSGTIAEQMFSINPTQVNNLRGGLLYFNLHSTTFPGGEIRGQIAAVPESQPLSLFGIVLAMGCVALLKTR